MDVTCYKSSGYDQSQRAYILSCCSEKPGRLQFKIAASEDHPIVNPAFVVKNWGQSDARITIDGRKIKRGRNFRIGHRDTLDGVDLIVWIKYQSTKPINASIIPVTD